MQRLNDTTQASTDEYGTHTLQERGWEEERWHPYS